MKYESFLWDFDGTLFDSYPHIAAALELTMTKYGIPFVHEEVMHHLQITYAAAYAKYGITPQMKEEFRRLDKNPAFRTAMPFAGTAAVLRAVTERGGRNFLCTHRGAETQAFLRLFGLDKYFSGGVDGTMHFPLKPAPDAVEYICRVYGLDRAKAVMIGDRELDIQAGVGAGVTGCLFSAREDLIHDTSAKYHVPDMYALAETLEIPLPASELPENRAKFLSGIQTECTAAAEQLIDAAKLTAGQTVIVGCSTSEVIGGHIGQDSAPDAAAAIFDALYAVFAPRGIHLAAQCCEHLNRAVIIDRAAWHGEEIVNAVPMPKAGGAFAFTAYRRFADPVAIAEIRADAGLDIGGTMIGMHLKKVAVPLRLPQKSVGAASLAAARVRPPFVGGERALYDAELL